MRPSSQRIIQGLDMHMRFLRWLLLSVVWFHKPIYSGLLLDRLSWCSFGQVIIWRLVCWCNLCMCLLSTAHRGLVHCAIRYKSNVSHTDQGAVLLRVALEILYIASTLAFLSVLEPCSSSSTSASSALFGAGMRRVADRYKKTYRQIGRGVSTKKESIITTDNYGKYSQRKEESSCGISAAG